MLQQITTGVICYSILPTFYARGECRMIMQIVVPPYTQTPNDLFDHWLPHLGEVELKVLLVIIRKTFGWHRKEDQISLSQLERFTGATQSNIGKAVKSLISKGLVSKVVSGPIGKQQTFYELVVVDDSNNSYPSQIERTPPPDSRGPPLLNQETQKKLPKEIEKEQQQSAVVLSEKCISKEQQQKQPTAAAAIHECLKSVDVPESLKQQLTKKYSDEEERVAKAVSWATDPDNPPLKSLEASLQYACANSLEKNASKQDVAEENRDSVMHLDLRELHGTRIDVHHSEVQFVFLGVQQDPICIPFCAVDFKSRLQKLLQKYWRITNV
jgi:phage replication O-like protein O